jgi:hypothetical protein
MVPNSGKTCSGLVKLNTDSIHLTVSDENSASQPMQSQSCGRSSDRIWGIVSHSSCHLDLGHRHLLFHVQVVWGDSSASLDFLAIFRLIESIFLRCYGLPLL